MSIKLFFQAIIKFLLGFIIMGALIFVSAGTLEFWNGWLLMGLLFIPMFIAGIVLMIKEKIKCKRKRKRAKRSNNSKCINVYFRVYCSRIKL